MITTIIVVLFTILGIITFLIECVLPKISKSKEKQRSAADEDKFDQARIDLMRKKQERSSAESKEKDLIKRRKQAEVDIEKWSKINHVQVQTNNRLQELKPSEHSGLSKEEKTRAIARKTKTKQERAQEIRDSLPDEPSASPDVSTISIKLPE
eukprot:TRINITY_DN4791_c0_g1_i2.p1 TRINITY_DN4791_c0_g1~~TRINITY_DN4791_c0_g1_i2.p1  ORF type:complete len:153 (+),score=22.50 TRINITY_DN4791_c0_g1_i2:24-482(+)